MAETGAATLDHQVTLAMDVLHGRATRYKEPGDIHQKAVVSPWAAYILTLK